MAHENRAIDFESLDLPQLVDRVQAGQHEAFRHLMQRCNQRLFRVARAVLNDDDEAEDALQEAWLRVFRRIHGFRRDAQITTWLTQIVLNECRDRLRRRRPTVALDEIPADTSRIVKFPTRFGMDDPAHTAGRWQARQLIEDAIETLPPAYRIVFMMRAVEEYSTEETADMLGIKTATVKTRLHRARAQLRRALQNTLAPAIHDAFPFLGPRCARITDRVMQRVQQPVGPMKNRLQIRLRGPGFSTTKVPPLLDR